MHPTINLLLCYVIYLLCIDVYMHARGGSLLLLPNVFCIVNNTKTSLVIKNPFTNIIHWKNYSVCGSWVIGIHDQYLVN